MSDKYAGPAMATPSTPARNLLAVTPSDTVDLPDIAKALYVGVTGDLVVTPADGGPSVTLKAHPVGYAPVQVKRVWSTGTTATNIVALLD